MERSGFNNMKNKLLSGIVVFGIWCCVDSTWAQDEYQQVKDLLTARLKAEKESQCLRVGEPKVDSVSVKGKSMILFCNDNTAYLSYREENVKQIYADLRRQLSSDYRKYRIQIWADGRPIEQHVPAYYRTGKDKTLKWAPNVDVPLRKNCDRPYAIKSGMLNRHIALWQSHGWYYEQSLDRWEWQRGRLMQTVEDLYTQSYVLPFLVPMLENAGANVLLPRERDVNRQEYILDNDEASGYSETEGKNIWETGVGPGFAHKQDVYCDFQNPFRDGTFRQVKTQEKGAESIAKWETVIKDKGEYAVYISYKTMKKSSRDALYTVHHAGGKTQFRINQQMAGGTWVYLGTFLFGEGQIAKVTLSNVSEKAGQIVTADAVKIGGGMGNIEREGLLSGYPRFTEGARYWLQWAGAPDSVYSMKHGEDDYTDDYVSRPRWVNWMAGGSAALPKREGLNVPIDLSLAFHSDAGVTKDDGIIGTLVIHKTIVDGRDTYANGASRYLAAELADLLQTQIVGDVRTLCAPEWSRRGKWNSSYAEARVPEVPAVLLELLSHQNFSDMRYGLDPRFRFIVSRAIYKGMLKFLCSQRGTEYVVQPLPVSNIRVKLSDTNLATLEWQPVADPLEPTATPHSYVVYTRMDKEGWDNGQLVTGLSYQTTLQAGHIYSWKVAAVNDGGCSFDSEILSAGVAVNPRKDVGTVLVINGFDRISAPADFDIIQEDGTQLAGFRDDYDHGVPYLRDISYIGQQKEFRRSIPWMDDDASGFGDSYADQEDRVIAGNTFDYPFIHGLALMTLGCNFTSCSNEAVEAGQVNLAEFPMVDLILGKQCQTKMGNGKSFPLEFKTFSAEMQHKITQYLQQYGGHFFVSGAYVGTDLWDNPLVKPIDSDKKFATDVLKYKWRANQAVRRGGIKQVRSDLCPAGDFYSYSDTLNAQCYIVESPDAIEPASAGAYTVFRYAQNNLSAAVGYRGEKYSTFIMGVPFETITEEQKREELMKTILYCLFGQSE